MNLIRLATLAGKLLLCSMVFLFLSAYHSSHNAHAHRTANNIAWSGDICSVASVTADTVVDSADVFENLRCKVKGYKCELHGYLNSSIRKGTSGDNEDDLTSILHYNDSVLNDLLIGMEEICNSPNIYTIQFRIESNSDGRLHIDTSTGELIFQFNNLNRSQVIGSHEIYHGIQYERGLNSITVDQHGGHLYSQQAEIQAYIVETVVLYRFKKVDLDSIVRMVRNDTSYSQSPLHTYGLNSDSGQILRERTKLRSLLNLPVLEFYNGWLEDYNLNRVSKRTLQHRKLNVRRKKC